MKKALTVARFFQLLTAMKKGYDFALFPNLIWRDDTTSVPGVMQDTKGCLLVVRSREDAKLIGQELRCRQLFTSSVGTTLQIDNRTPKYVYDTLGRYVSFQVEIQEPPAGDETPSVISELKSLSDLSNPHHRRWVTSFLDDLERERDNIAALTLNGESEDGRETVGILAVADEAEKRSWERALNGRFHEDWCSKALEVTVVRSGVNRPPRFLLALSNNGSEAVWWMIQHHFHRTTGRVV